MSRNSPPLSLSKEFGPKHPKTALGLSRRDSIVPFATELGWDDVQAGNLRVRHLDALFAGVLVQPALHGEASLRGGAGDQLHDDLGRKRRLAAPVLSDERGEAVLDTVPFAGAGWHVRDGDRQSDLIGKRLQLGFP